MLRIIPCVSNQLMAKVQMRAASRKRAREDSVQDIIQRGFNALRQFQSHLQEMSVLEEASRSMCLELKNGPKSKEIQALIPDLIEHIDSSKSVLTGKTSRPYSDIVKEAIRLYDPKNLEKFCTEQEKLVLDELHEELLRTCNSVIIKNIAALDEVLNLESTIQEEFKMKSPKR